jgi:hypothetical protein
VIALLDSRKVDVAAVAHALDGLRAGGATCQAYLQADGHDVCVNAVNGGGHGWPEYPEAVSRRAATRGRRLLPVLDSGEVEGRLWIAYDMGSTTSLPKYRGHHPLPTATCIRVLSDVARALDDAAGDGFFPSELAPDSVFVSRRGARLGDLGTAREAIARAEFELEGDPAFVPPEVLHGERAGERSGVYLFGALLYHLIAGTSPQRGHSTSLGGPRPDLPVSIKSIVAKVMADDPTNRPATACEAYDMARRALRGEPPARPSGGRRWALTPKPEVAPKAATAPRSKAAAPKPAAAPKRAPAPKTNGSAPKPAPASKPNSANAHNVAKPAAAQPASPKPAATKPDTRQPAARKAAAEAPVRRRPATMKPSPQAVGAKVAGVATGLAASVGTRLSHRKPSIPRPQRRRPNVSAESRRRASSSGAAPKHRLRAVAVGGALVLGAAAGLVLGRSPDPEPARARGLTAAGLSITLPPGWHPLNRSDEGLSARSESNVSLQARMVDRPLELQEGYKAVRLGSFQVWRHAAPGAADYTTSTSEGTLVVTCRAPTSGGPGLLRECERAASTLRLRGARALPLVAALEDSERLRAAVAAVGAERDRARTRLSHASTPRGQRRLARDLARIHTRAATALDGAAEADSIKAAALGAADAYSSLAASAGSGSARRWDTASERVRRRETVLAKAIATAG